MKQEKDLRFRVANFDANLKSGITQLRRLCVWETVDLKGGTLAFTGAN